jgi:acyl carrier protein
MPTQTDKTLVQQVVELVSSHCDIPKDRISLDSAFKGDLGFDSLTQVEFIMAVEEQFGIEVPDEAASEIKTVRRAVAEIERRMGMNKPTTDRPAEKMTQLG